MKYTVEHKGFFLYIQEIQEEEGDICFEGRCRELKFINRQLYRSGFWRLISKFQHEVDNNGMTQHYLVKYKSNWADEMGIYGLRLLTGKEKNSLEKLIRNSRYPLTHYIGTNEEINYYSSDQLSPCYTWTPITEDEYKTLYKLIGAGYGHFFHPDEIDEEDKD